MYFRCDSMDQQIARWEAANIDPPEERAHKEEDYDYNNDEAISQDY